MTGSTAHVGNWPGVTVERREGKYRKGNDDVKIIDLPGIYSLSPYTAEEVVARDYLAQEKPDVIINIVDASNMECNLYLTTQLLELGIPTVIALNMMDEVKAHGDEIDIANFEKQMGVPIVPITATKSHGIKELMERAITLAKRPESVKKTALEGTKIFDSVKNIR